MSAAFQEPQNTIDVRFDAETVRKATVLAARLQREKEQTLSLQEVDDLAAELNIDPECMRRALGIVRRTQGGKSQAAALLAFVVGVSLAALGLAIPILWLYLARSTVSASAAVIPMTTPVVAEDRLQPRPTVLRSTSLLRNGCFNHGPKITGSGVLEAGSYALRGWEVVSGNVGYIRKPGSVSPGDRCVVLGVEERLRQVFRTQPGRTYRITLSMMGKPGPVAKTHTLVVRAGNVHWTHSYFTEAQGEQRPGWRLHQMEFRAENEGTTLDLTANVNDNGEPSEVILDNVSVVPVEL